MEFLFIFFLLLLVVLAVFISYRVERIKERDITNRLTEINQQHGTNFNFQNYLGEGFSFIFFDPEAQKILITNCLITRICLEDFSFIRGWQLKWIATTNWGIISYSNVRIEFYTNDYESPIISFSCKSKEHGDFWHARLGILFG